MDHNDEVSPSPPAPVTPPVTPPPPEHNNNSAAAATVAANNNNIIMSPSPQQQHHQNHQHLNYHQQQQLHQRHIQRTGGLQRLTADLAGLQFNDVEALFKAPLVAAKPATAGAHRKKSRVRAHESTSSKQVPDCKPKLAAPAVATAGTQSPTQVDMIASEQQPRGSIKVPADQQVPANLAAYEEQMTIAHINSQNGPEYDPAKDAQETAEDAQLLKRFKLIGLVGTGNYARVYKVVTQHGKEVACKAINLSKTSENYKQKFLPRELTILKTISHANICKTHEIFQSADRIFILMQFCSHGTIADLLYRLGPLSESVTRNLFVQIMDAVHYLHNLEYAHRDLKVENILLDQEFSPKLTDFSYSVNTSSESKHHAKSHQSLASTKTLGKVPNLPLHPRVGGSMLRLNDTFCGTLPYLSPEMIRLLHYDPKKTDIWSLGVCLYIMLNDRLPFPFNDIKQMVRKQLTKDYKFKTGIEYSDQVRELINLMLEPEFARRPTSHDVNRHPWMSGPREKPPAPH